MINETEAMQTTSMPGESAGETAISTYEVTAPSGKVYVLRPLPKHFFFFSSELPGGLSDRAALALKTGDAETLGQEVIKQMSAEQIQKTLIFVREAVKAAMVKPRLTMSPAGPDEMSPFEMEEKDFEFITAVIMQGGEQAKILTSFRR